MPRTLIRCNGSDPGSARNYWKSLPRTGLDSVDLSPKWLRAARQPRSSTSGAGGIWSRERARPVDDRDWASAHPAAL